MNEVGVINTLGFSIYCYEGIGIVMPVMATAAEPEKFKAMLTYAFITLIIIFVAFSCFTYSVWGSNLSEPIVTQMLPADSVAAIIIKFLYSLNLVCSYPIVIYPANTAVETWFCSCLKKRAQRRTVRRAEEDSSTEMQSELEDEEVIAK